MKEETEDNISKLFTSLLSEEIKDLPKEEQEKIDLEYLGKINKRGQFLVNQLRPFLDKELPGYEIVATEYELRHKINEKYDFLGYIDLIVKHEEQYYIIDHKSSGLGWSESKKNDKMTVYQLVLYKHFYAEENGIELDKISTRFILFKRDSEEKKKDVEFVEATSGKVRIKNALRMVDRMIKNIEGGKFIKNKLNCKNCEYFSLCRINEKGEFIN